MNNNQHLTIRVPPETTPQLRMAVLDWMEPFDAASTSAKRPKLLHPNERYLDINVVKKRLDAILADGRVDPVESFGFYKAVASIAGPDAVLQDNEVPRLALRLMQVVTGINPGQEPLNEFDLLAFGSTPIQDFTKIFADSGEVRKQTVELLNELDVGIWATIALAQDLYNLQKKREQSYFNFVSAENGWGISSWFTSNHEPPSVARMRGTYRFLQELQDQQAGLDILRASIPMGIFPDDNFYVKKFLNGPFPVSIALREFLVEGETRQSASRTIAFIRQLVQMAMTCGTEDLALILAKMAQRMDLDVKVILSDILPSATARFVSGTLTDFANSGFSLHHMLVYSASFACGKLLAARFDTLSTGLGVATARHGFQMALPYWLLPGVRFFGGAVAGESWLGLRGLRILGNFGAECIKWGSYTGGGYIVAGNIGLHIGGMTYLGLLGGISGWLSGKLLAVGAELANGGQGRLIGNMLASGTSESGLWRLVQEGAHAVNMRTLRLAPGIPGNGAAPQTQVFVRDLSKSVRTQELAHRQLEKLVRDAQKLTDRHPERLGDSFMARIQGLAENPDPVKAVRDVRMAIAGWRSTYPALSMFTRKSSRPSISAATPPQGFNVSVLPKRPKQLRPDTPPNGGEKMSWRKRQAPNDPRPPRTPGTPMPANPLDLVVASPPQTLTEEIITQLGKGRIRFTSSAWRDAIELYGSNAMERGAFLRRLRELGEANGTRGNEWRAIRAGRGCFRAHVGIHHRILVQRVDGHYRVYRVTHRENLKGPRDWEP